MITGKSNERLKLVRRLSERRGREREGLFLTEGEDLLTAGRRAGLKPVEVLTVPGSGIEGTVVEPALLAEASALGSGTRALVIWPLPDPPQQPAEPCVYLDAVADPANVGAIVRSAAALTGATVVLGPGCADPYSPKAARASMGALFALPPYRGPVEATPRPRLGLVAHGGADLEAAIVGLGPMPTLCLGSERGGLDDEALAACDAVATIRLHPGVESLNVAAAAAIALQRISSAAAQKDG